MYPGDGLIGFKTAVIGSIVTVRYSRLDDNADAGLDSKADLSALDQVSATGNGHYGFRFWGRATATTLTCVDSAWECIEAEAKEGRHADVTIDRLVMVGGEELVTTKAGAVVTILSCDLTRWTGKALVKGQGNVALEVGCSVTPR